MDAVGSDRPNEGVPRLRIDVHEVGGGKCKASVYKLDKSKKKLVVYDTFDLVLSDMGYPGMLYSDNMNELSYIDACVNSARMAAIDNIRVELVLNMIGALQEQLDSKEIHDKRKATELIMGLLDRFGLAFQDERGHPCSLIVINDIWGGKFALQSRIDKKRSKTTRTLKGKGFPGMVILDNRHHK